MDHCVKEQIIIKDSWWDTGGTQGGTQGGHPQCSPKLANMYWILVYFLNWGVEGFFYDQVKCFQIQTVESTSIRLHEVFQHMTFDLGAFRFGHGPSRIAHWHSPCSFWLSIIPKINLFSFSKNFFSQKVPNLLSQFFFAFMLLVVELFFLSQIWHSRKKARWKVIIQIKKIIFFLTCNCPIQAQNSGWSIKQLLYTGL